MSQDELIGVLVIELGFCVIWPEDELFSNYLNEGYWLLFHFQMPQVRYVALTQSSWLTLLLYEPETSHGIS